MDDKFKFDTRTRIKNYITFNLFSVQGEIPTYTNNHLSNFQMKSILTAPHVNFNKFLKTS